MQEIEYRDKDGQLQRARELFHGKDEGDVFDKMRARFAEQESQGEVISMKRTKLEPDALCPCGSGRKVKRCCRNKIK